MLFKFSLPFYYLIKDGIVPASMRNYQVVLAKRKSIITAACNMKVSSPTSSITQQPTQINPSNQQQQVETPAHQTASLFHLAIFSSQRAKLRHLRRQSSSTLHFLHCPYPPVQPRRQIVPAGYFPYCWGPKRECTLPVLRGCVRRDGCEVSI